MTLFSGWTRGGRKRLGGALLALAVVGGYAAWDEWATERELSAALAVAETGDLPAARRRLDACLTRRPTSGRVLHAAGRAARRTGDFPAARRLLDRAAAAGWPADTVAWERKLLAAQTGDFAAVEPDLRKFVAAAPDHPDADVAREVLVPGYLARYDMSSAFGLCRQWVERRPADPRVRMWQFEAARNVPLYDEAEAAVRAAVELAPDQPEVRAAAAGYLLDRRNPAAAAAHFDWLLARDPTDPAARLGRAKCRRELGDPAAALSVLGPLLQSFPSDPVVLAEVGLCDLQAGRPADARGRLQAAAATGEYEPAVLYSLAVACDQTGDPAEAAAVRTRLTGVEADRREIAELLKKLDADPQNPDLRHRAGVLCLRAGQAAAGVQWLQSALAAKPDHAPSRQALAEAAAKRKR